MTRKFTQNLLSIVLSFFIGFLINPINANAQNCAIPTGISTSNVSNFTATANWTIDNNVDHYRLRYMEISATSWQFNHGIIGNSQDLSGLTTASTYVWQIKAFCSPGSTNSSSWSILDTFITTSYIVDCNNTPNGLAYIDSCGNCVGGLTGASACIPFSPTVAISLSTLECNAVADIAFTTSQDPNEPDMSSSVFSSDGGYFNFTGLATNDTIGSSVITAGGGYFNVDATLMVDFIITSDKISEKLLIILRGVFMDHLQLKILEMGF